MYETTYQTGPLEIGGVKISRECYDIARRLVADALSPVLYTPIAKNLIERETREFLIGLIERIKAEKNRLPTSIDTTVERRAA